MTGEKYQLWLDYRRGKIKRQLTDKEKKEIRASDFAVFLLVPERALLDLITQIPAGPTQLLDMQQHGFSIVKKLADYFKVNEEVMEIRLRLLADRIWST